MPLFFLLMLLPRVAIADTERRHASPDAAADAVFFAAMLFLFRYAAFFRCFSPARIFFAFFAADYLIIISPALMSLFSLIRFSPPLIFRIEYNRTMLISIFFRLRFAIMC